MDESWGRGWEGEGWERSDSGGWGVELTRVGWVESSLADTSTTWLSNGLPSTPLRDDFNGPFSEEEINVKSLVRAVDL